MIRDHQYRALLEVIGEANGAADLEEFRSCILPGARRLVPADFASYNEIPSGPGPQVAITDPDLPDWAYAVWERLAPTNPLVQRYQRTHDGRPYRFSDVMAKDELRRLPLYVEMYEPLGIEHQIALVLPSPPSLTIGLALSRGPGRDFHDAERDLLALLRPHLIQAYRNAQLRGQAGALLEALRHGLDAGGVAAIVVGDDHTVAYASESARRWVDVGDGEPLPELPGTTPEGDALLHRRVGAVVFLERAARVLTPAALEDLGLTPAEARVLAALARGLSTAEAASGLGLSPRTVLKHSERIHRKLGVHDRAQAIAAAWAATVPAAPA